MRDERRRAEGFSIRPLRPEDDAAVAAIIRRVMTAMGAAGPGFAIHDAEVDAMAAAYARPRCRYFVVERDGVVLGGAGIAPLEGADAETCELRKMYFLPEARGLGLGRSLLDRCLDAARELGFARCYLETLKTMTAARALYRAAGFEPLPAARGRTGHFSCDAWYQRELRPPSDSPPGA